MKSRVMKQSPDSERGSCGDEKLRLPEVVRAHRLSLTSGHVQTLDGKWYITHSGLLQIAQRSRCSGIQTEVATELSDPSVGRWVVKATVYKAPRSKGFVGYGDANPSNVSPLVRGAELRVAETRAVNRALRKAYGIGLCSVEELGAGPTRSGPTPVSIENNNGNGQPRLRDRLLLIIRQHHLDAEQVKHYATRFCGISSLREASREQVESFVNHLATLATENREQLLAELSACVADTPAAAVETATEATPASTQATPTDSTNSHAGRNANRRVRKTSGDHDSIANGAESKEAA